MQSIRFESNQSGSFHRLIPNENKLLPEFYITIVDEISIVLKLSKNRIESNKKQIHHSIFESVFQNA